MKVSYNWLQDYFEKSLLASEKISELFTNHAFEVEGVEKVGDDTVFDFKILPNRAHDCLSHDGIARELSVLSGIPLKQKVESRKWKVEDTEYKLKITVEDHKLCRRYAGRIFENVKIGQSPEWMKKRLEAIGQRSINNVVDITNYVMFATGQPLHAFDADKLAGKGSEKEIIVRTVKKGEKLVTLDAKDIRLDETMLVICDSEKPVALAGIKGGKWAEVDANTKHIILESANFEPTSTRKTAVKVGIRTDSEKRFENEITPELAGRAMGMATELLAELASTKETKIGEVVDVYPRQRRPYKIGVSVGEVNKVLGTKMTEKEVGGILEKLKFEHEIVDNPTAQVLKLAQKFVGMPYKLGAGVLYDAPNSFDCSSLVVYLFANAGIKMPRIAVEQFAWTERISEKEIQAGDLVFSNTGSSSLRYETTEFLPGTKVSGGVSHVGILLDKDTVLHASSTKGKVIIEKLSESDRFQNVTGFGRVSGADKRRFTVTIPIERLDFNPRRHKFLSAGNPEDLIEEIGRIYGFDNLPSPRPPKTGNEPEINKALYYSGVVRKILAKLGFSEVQTYTFVPNGEVELENPMAEDKKFLRPNLSSGLAKSLELNEKNAPLLGLEQVKIFEIGKVFTMSGEYTSCALAVSEQKKNPARTALVAARAALGKALGTDLEANPPSGGIWEFDFDALVPKLPEPKEYEVPESPRVIYKPISQYPFALRDIAVFVPSGTDKSAVKKIIENEAGDLLVRNDLFDKFEKGGKISYAFHLVFQSYEKTLSDDELNEIMSRITGKLNGKTGWQVR